LVASATGAPGPDWPKVETFLGYNFVRFNPNSNFIPSFNANGGSGQFVYNVKRWVGVAFEAGAVNKGTLGGFNVNTTVVHFVAGPRFRYHNHSRFTPYAEALFGGAYATTSASIDLFDRGLLPPGLLPPQRPDLPFTASIGASHTGFAMFLGGGLDIKVGKHVAFRPIGVDYYLTRVPSFAGGTSNRNNFRYMAGVNFLFGGAQ
jgi:hypothetical protein